MPLPAAPAVAWVALGGAAGAVARVAVTVAVGVPAGGWPWSTLLANLTGALLLGLLLGGLRDAAAARPWVRPLVGTGVLGGYTTFSTLSVETFDLVVGGRAALAVAYAASSAAGGFVAVWLGATLAPAVLRRRSREG